MSDRKSSKLKTQSFKNDEFFSRQVFELQFGKPIRLPYIRNNNATLDRRSIEKQLIEKIVLNSKKKKKIVNASQLDLLTAQELQLCENKQQLNSQNIKKCFPKLNYNSREQTSRLARIKSQKNIIKLQHHQMLKDYKLGSIIGRGSYSTVKLAKNLLGKKYAIKEYSKLKLDTIDKQQNLERQIRILKQITHQNIVSFIESIETQDSVYIVTQLFDNTSLQDLLKKQEKKKFACQDALQIMKQVFKAFSYLHNKGIIHRDVKLENILVSKDFHVKIIDFGFSTFDEGILYDFCGTPHYIAPQVIQKKGYYGKPADVWSLGVVFYRLVTGSFPFKGMNEKNIYSKINRGEFKMPQIGTQVQQLIKKMLIQNPTERITIDQILQHQSLFNSAQK